MSDQGVGIGSGAGPSQSSTFDERELSLRVKLVAGSNPYMAQSPEALVQMAMSPMGTDQLVATAGQHYAMQVGSGLADQLKGMTPGAQRAIMAQLTPGQQQALGQMGYKTPSRDETSLLGDFANIVKVPLGIIGGGALSLPGVRPAIHDAMTGLTWLQNWPAHLYRTARLGDNQSQWMALAGGIAGLAAVALAIPTGGGSLMALGALGLGATAGMTAGSFATNPNDWIRSFNSSWNGEKTFSADARRQVDDMLGDPKLTGAAHDLASQGVNVVDFAKEMAGHRAIDRASQMKELETFADRMAVRDTPDWQRAVSTLTSAMADPTFQRAVQTLNNSKISPGRDLASTIGLQPGTGTYSLVSGATDAMFTVAVDPTLMLGYGHELWMAKKYTIPMEVGGEGLAIFRNQVHTLPGVMRNYEALAAAVEAGKEGGIQALRVRAPQMEALFGDLVEYRQGLRDTGALREPFNAEHVIDYLTNETRFKPLLEGKGTVQNVRGLQLTHTSATRMAFREFRGEVRGFVNGMADISTEARYTKLVKEHGPQEALVEVINDAARKRGTDFESLAPPSMNDLISEDGAIAQPWRFNQHNPTGYVVGRAFADTASKLPLLGRTVGKVGEAITAMTTMSIAGKVVSLTGDGAVKEIRALSELGRYMGMPSYYRQAWADVIVNADSSAGRYNAMNGWLANMLHTTGIDATEEGKAIVEEYLQRSRQLYGASDTVLVNGEPMHAGMFLNEQADMVVMPDLRELRRAAQTGQISKLMGIVDHPVLETAINKVWKPAVLFRLGFIPRAGGEEAAAWAARGGLGSILQEFGGRNLGRRAAADDVLRRFESGPFVSKFTRAEQALLDGGRYSYLPSHVRPLVRMMARVGWEDPGMKIFDRYGNWLAEQLSTGIGGRAAIEGRLADFGGQALEAPRFAAPDAGLSARLLGRRGFGSEAQRLGIAPLDTQALHRLNVADYANSILLGNPYSLRRMILGGVHTDLVEAGMEWAKTHSTTVMRETSAINAGPLDPGHDASDLHTHLGVDPKTGELRREVVMDLKGQRVTYARGDRMYANALNEDMERPMASAAMKEELAQSLVRFGSPNVQERDLGPAADHLFNMGRHVDDPEHVIGSLARGRQARAITRQFLGPFNRDQWDAMIAKLAYSDSGKEIALALDGRLPTLGEFDVKDVISALAAHRNMIADAHKAEYLAKGSLSQQRVSEHFDEINHITKLMEDLDYHGRPVINYLQRLPYADQQMAGQFLDHVIVAGDKSVWAQRKLALESERINSVADAAQGITRPVVDQGEHALTSDTWLHRKMDELTPERIDRLSSMIMNPAYHDKGVTKTLRGLETDAKGQYTDTAFRDATSTLYEAPDLRGLTYDQILAHSANRDLIAANEGVIRQVIEHPDDAQALLGDFRLAKELHRIDASIAGVGPDVANIPRNIRVPRTIAQGRVQGNIIPDTVTKIGEETQLWHMPRRIASRRLEPTEEILADKARDMATTMISRHNDVIRRGNAELLVAKGRVDEAGFQVPVVHRWNNGELTPIQPGQRIPLDWQNQLQDHMGRPIAYEDSQYLRHAPLTEAPGDDLMWEALGPMMRDVHADLNGETALRRKLDTAVVTKGGYSLPSQLRQTADVVPVKWSKVTDIDMIPGTDRPANAIGRVFENRQVGGFEKFIQFGFDRVIGPSLDAIIRKPMSFHAFANRYINAKQALSWTLDPELVAKTGDLITQYAGHAHGVDINPEALARQARGIASFQGDKQATTWTTNEAMAWLRSHSKDDMADLLVRTLTRASGDDSAAARGAAVYARQLARQDFTKVQAALQTGTDMPSLVKTIEAALPEGALRSAAAMKSREVKDAIAANPMLTWLDEGGHWDVVRAASKNLQHVQQTAGELAATAAIGDVMPFIHNHSMKTQFADYGRGILPFWYAEENFLKRWGRGLRDAGPAAIERAMLTYMGMKEAGVVRTDPSGHDWFVYPGSGLLADVIGRIPGMAAMQNAGIMFETPTESMLPGLNNHVGTPSFSPLVTLPMGLITALAPELQPATRAMIGDTATESNVLKQLVPAAFRNLYSGIFGGGSDTRVASAMSSAITYLAAHGDIPDTMTPGQAQQFLERVTNHGRIINLVRSVAGFIVPGSPSEIVAGKSANVLGLDVQDPSSLFASEYVQLVRDLGVEAGTAKFLEINKDATIDDVVSPLAYTVPKNASTSGAPIPVTESALSFYDANSNYMHEFPNAAPWLLPPVNGDSYSQFAADQMTVNGLRKRRSPEELLNATLFKTAAQEYFATRDTYNAKIDQATVAGDNAMATNLRNELMWKQQVYRLAHPIFTEQLQSSDGRAQRLKTLDEMRSIIDDPQHPDVPHFAELAQSVRVFEAYKTHLGILANDSSAKGKAEVEHLKQQYSAYMNALTSANPAIMPFWVSVLRPESSL